MAEPPKEENDIEATLAWMRQRREQLSKGRNPPEGESTAAWMRRRQEQLQEVQSRPRTPVRVEGPAPVTRVNTVPAPPPRRTVDPRTQNVFVQGPDGKLHPVPGWGITGAHDYGTWARMIDWQGVGEDLYKIAKRARKFMKPDPKGWGQTALELGRELYDDLPQPQQQQRK